jgi:predicted ArsR family transcriptional regulator
MKKATSDQIISLLTDHPHLTSVELSYRLNRSAADIRYQLDRLIQRGKVQKSGIRKPLGRGKPPLTFTINTSDNPDMVTLIQSFINAINVHVSALSNDLIDFVAMDMARRYRTPGVIPSAESLTALSIQLSSYRCQWEPSKQGPKIVFHRCPYLALGDGRSIICDIERRMLQHLLKSDLIISRTMLSEEEVICEFNFLHLASIHV